MPNRTNRSSRRGRATGRRNRNRRYQALFTSSFASATTVGFGGVQYVTQASIASGTTVSSGLRGSSAANIIGGAGHHDRRHHGAHGTGGATIAALIPGRPGRPWGEAAATTRAPTPPAPTPAVLRRGRPPGARAEATCGAADRAAGRLPACGPVSQWRQNYPNNQPPTRATVISATGGAGSQPSTSFVIRSHVKPSFWLRRRSVRRQRSAT
jgi:hypothetical protein